MRSHSAGSIVSSAGGVCSAWRRARCQDGGEAPDRRGSGSGFFIEGGYIVSNNHVVEDAKSLNIKLQDGRLSGTLLGTDPKTDLAVVKIERGSNLPRGLAWGGSTRARPGDNVFAIDFDEKSVRVSRCLNLIAGDGETNVLHLNTLDWTKWDETAKQNEWLDTYGDDWRRLRKLRVKEKGEAADSPSYRSFGFDVLMANP